MSGRVGVGIGGASDYYGRGGRRSTAGETIFVHGDYDVDGMCAAALFTLVLRRLGAQVVPFVPHRMRDGYDLGPAGVRRAREAGAGVILTADCGVVARDAVDAAAAEGIDVIVTDRQGNPIDDLTLEDFEITEDGKPQRPETFRLVRVDAITQPAYTSRTIRTRNDEETAAQDENSRIFIFFLDDYHVRRETSMSVKKPIVDFIVNQLAPGDLIVLSGEVSDVRVPERAAEVAKLQVN